MKKLTIIIGPRGSGKNRMAKSTINNIIRTFIPRQRFLLSDPFYFSSCTQDTELILFDEIQSEWDIAHFIEYANSGITVNKKGKEAFLIYPEIVIICSSVISREEISRILKLRKPRMPYVLLDLFPITEG